MYLEEGSDVGQSEGARKVFLPHQDHHCLLGFVLGLLLPLEEEEEREVELRAQIPSRVCAHNFMGVALNFNSPVYWVAG